MEFIEISVRLKFKFMKIFKPCAFNEIGQRENQEDSLFPAVGEATTESHLFLVCDGMGGHERGEIASSSVCDSFSEYLKDIVPDKFNSGVFSKALTFAYNELDNIDESYAKTAKKPGTTLTFVYLNDNGVFAAHIGDSRIYHLRQGKDNQVNIVYKSSDHSLVNELLRAGVITEEEAVNHPRKNVITRAMQPYLETRFKATPYETSDVADGDYFFMCSDGVLETIDDKLLCEILATDATDEDKMNKIKELCGDNSQDNHTAYLIHVKKGVDPAKRVVTPTQSTTAEVTPQTISVAVSECRKSSCNKRMWWIGIFVAAVLVGSAGYFIFSDDDKKIEEQSTSSTTSNGGEKQPGKNENSQRNNDGEGTSKPEEDPAEEQSATEDVPAQDSTASGNSTTPNQAAANLQSIIAGDGKAESDSNTLEPVSTPSQNGAESDPIVAPPTPTAEGEASTTNQPSTSGAGN